MAGQVFTLRRSAVTRWRSGRESPLAPAPSLARRKSVSPVKQHTTVLLDAAQPSRRSPRSPGTARGGFLCLRSRIG